MSGELTVAIAAAKAGAKCALSYYRTDLHIVTKPDNTPVTKADRESEEVIKSTIRQQFPDAHFVGEETGGAAHEESFWIIDPIDGTKFFIRSLPLWSILIAYCRNGQIEVGVSYMPVLGEILVAQIGKGAFLNGKRVQVSKIGNLSDAFFNADNIADATEETITLAKACMNARSIGNPWGYHHLAQGKVDISIDMEYGGMWDIAPFKVIIEESGGRITNLDGEAWKIADTNCVATNGLLHEGVIRILNKKD